MGSTLAARQAGMNAATEATAASSNNTREMLTGSTRCTPNSNDAIHRLAAAWFITATFAEELVSCAASGRPSTIGMPIVSKNSGLTLFIHIVNGWPLSNVGEDSAVALCPPPIKGCERAAAETTPGVARIDSRMRSYSGATCSTP